MAFHPFLNNIEQRLRSFWRIFTFLIFFVVLFGLGGIIGSDVVKYLYFALVTSGLMYIQYRYIDKRSMEDGGIQLKTSWFIEIGWGSLIGFLAVTVIFLIQWSFGMLVITDFEWTRLNTNYVAILFFLIQMLSVGFYEEAAFRGVFMKNMAEGFHFEKGGVNIAIIAAILLSSSLFGLAHINNPNASFVSTFNIILAGVMLAVPYILTGSLALPIGIHLSWNFALGGFYGFKVSGLAIQHSIIHIRQTGYELWTGGSFGPEAGLLGILGMILIIGLCLVYVKIKFRMIGLHSSFKESFETKYLSEEVPK